MGRFRLNQLKVRRLGGMTAVAAFALVMLAACGGGGEEAVTEDVTRVPVTSDAAGEATQEAVQQEEASTPAVVVIETEASPVVATPALAVTSTEATPAVAASPVAAMTAGATPVTAAMPAEATPMTAPTTTEATPEQTAATPVGATAGAAASPVASGTAATPGAAAAGTESVEVVSHDIFFEPKELTIPADTDVTVSLPNEGVTLHNFSIDELGISVDLAPGATEEAVVNAPAGTYEYYCNVPGHKEAGMVGTLTVA
jgi:uncharacterized cupredoxin-like copper-binding protein